VYKLNGTLFASDPNANIGISIYQQGTCYRKPPNNYCPATVIFPTCLLYYNNKLFVIGMSGACTYLENIAYPFPTNTCLSSIDLTSSSCYSVAIDSSTTFFATANNTINQCPQVIAPTGQSVCFALPSTLTTPYPFFATQLNYLSIFDMSGNGFNTLNLGVSPASSYVIRQLNNTSGNIYMGTTFGIIIEYNYSISTGGITFGRLVFYPAPIIDLQIDTNFITLLAGTADGAVLKIGLDTFGINSYNKLPGIISINSLKLLPSYPALRILAKTNSTTFQIFITTTNICNLYYNCFLCASADPTYCSWCNKDSLCRANFTVCGADTVTSFTYNTACPTITNVSPQQGTANGGTVITINGTNLLAGQNVVCNLTGNILYSVNKLSATAVTCTTMQQAAGPYNITLTNNHNWYGNSSFIYSFFNCNSSTNCGSCNMIQSCVWCLSSAACQSQNSVCAFSSSGSCPIISFVTPKSSTTNGNTSVIVIGTLFNASLQLYCNFDFNSSNNTQYTVNASFINSTALNCLTPAHTSGHFVLEITGPNAANKNVSYTTNFTTFEFFECNIFNNCALCVTPDHPLCLWCAANQICTGNIAVCTDNNFYTNNDTQCPSLINIVPPFAGFSGGNSLTVYGSPNSFFNGYNYNCSFGIATVSAVVINNSTLK
jgi:hypothetical protein